MGCRFGLRDASRRPKRCRDTALHMHLTTLFLKFTPGFLIARQPDRATLNQRKQLNQKI